MRAARYTFDQPIITQPMIEKFSINQSKAGFTFIELLVVMLIISIVATFVTLNFGNFGKNRRLQATAKEIYLLLQAAQQQAVLQPAVLKFTLQNRSYRFYVFREDSTANNNGWQALSHDSLFKSRSLDKDLLVTLKEESNKNDKNDSANDITEFKDSTQLVFLPSGYVTPFKLRVGLRNQPAVYEILGNAAGVIQLQMLNKHDS